MEAFRAKYPRYQNIFYETLPPGILEQQIETGSLVTGNLTISHRPDMFVAGEERLRRLDEKHGYFSEIRPYYRNRLAIMVREGNPKAIRSLEDLGREDVSVSMPNPETEGIARKAIEAFEKAGGDDLANWIMETKVRDGTTFVTQIHHRQTPMRIMEGSSDAGPVWRTEAMFQRRIGNPIEKIDIPEEHNVRSTTAAGVMKNALHKEAARRFLEFLTSEQSAAIDERHGFEPIRP
jgi:ABC-type molybdate transport system substrate-binding protein